MNQLHRWIFSLGLLLCLIACTWGAMTVYGFEGQEVTLPCNYDSKYHGICHVCWMRGSIPNQGCGMQVIYANEKQVEMRGDARYQLRGALQNGDASLTILNAKKSDSGKYGCRVHVPGWFNDKKFEMYLEIMEATQQPTTTPGYVTTAHVKYTTQQPTTTPGYVTTTTHVTYMQHKTVTVPQPVTTKRPGKTSTRHRHVTTTALIPTKETEQITETLENEDTTIHTVTDVQDEKLTTTEHEVTTDNFPDASSPIDKLVDEDRKEVLAILVPIILILMILGIISVYLLYKRKIKFRTSAEVTKSQSVSVGYSNLDSCVTLPKTNSSGD
ncbi:uncharacterized protein Hap1MRO34_001585 isoform 2-T2 [Clarias gariepinus]|uniref:hepatitis A virus cellular receptor 1 homolog isoform X2 n=1 Tax=Clarias gariepinus TaxID=13013 RepID=UPI00234CA467|nr:hepatitis A virus cellular receptor 1 homolog isoform X2 [Clarias gariepinus]